MTTDRGFVQSIDVGRGGLATINVLLADGSVAVYVISDLDGDPERFNERLSKLALLRDAMNRAEPVEIDHEPGPAGEEIDRAERITRDTLSNPAATDTIVGLVVGIAAHSGNQAGASGELADYAQVAILSSSGGVGTYLIDLQIPERGTAAEQLALVRNAYAEGAQVRLVVATADQQGNQWVIEVSSGAIGGGNGDTGTSLTVGGFVESLSLMPVSLPSSFGTANLASVGFTTAPEFTGPGGSVDTSPFTPELMQLVVVEGSLTYKLFKAGLQDNLRMEVQASQPGHDGPPINRGAPDAGTVEGADDSPASKEGSRTFMVVGAELIAPLASASRPVWIQIDRKMLDTGPAEDCVPGVPSSDLTPKTLRDLGIPYTALWRGLGCFNRGVYRFQIQPPARVKIVVDDRELCIYQADTPGVVFAYACIEGDHEVQVELEGWTCKADFGFDVYRVR